MSGDFNVGDRVLIVNSGKNGVITHTEWQQMGYGSGNQELVYTVKLDDGQEIKALADNLKPVVASAAATPTPKPFNVEPATAAADKKYNDLKQKYDALLQQYNALKNKFSQMSSQAVGKAKGLASTVKGKFGWGGKRHRRKITRRKRNRKKTHKRR